MKTAFICICSEEYLGYYRVLYNSLKKYSPDTKQVLYFIGKNVPTEFDEVFDITNWYNEANFPTPIQKICSLRARVVLEAFTRYDAVIFTGAKVEFFSAPIDLLANLNLHQVVATPHITEPLPEDGKFPSNASVCFTGHISTDLVAFRNTPEVKEFLHWQDTIMKTQCGYGPQTYLDQTWLNCLPFFLENVKILKHPGYNVAYWNFKQRNMRLENDNWIVNNKDQISYPLIAFQYSGLENPENISKYQTRYKAEGDFLEFLKSYIERKK